MKLSEILKVRAPKKFKIKRPVVKDVGNDKIVYLGTDAIQKSFSGTR
jgi:hypothetical protein